MVVCRDVLQGAEPQDGYREEVSSLWTPDGERPVRPNTPAREPSRAAARPPDGEPTEEELAAEMAAVQAEIARTPASAIVGNHCMGLFQLAAVHLSQDPPNLGEAAVAIDAFSAVTSALKGRLGPEEATLAEALQSLQMAFVQMRSETTG